MRLRRLRTGAGVRVGTVVALVALGAAGFLTFQLTEEKRLRREVRERSEFLERELERLQESIKSLHAEKESREEQDWKARVEATTAEVRGLPYLEEVRYSQLKRADMGSVVEKKIAEVYTEQEIKDAEFGYEAIGLLPRGFELKKAYVKLLGEQVAAFYDQHENRLFTFGGTPLKKLQHRIILAHELTHALQDQHFKLENFPLEIKDNDDIALAISALVEGDATLAMSQYVLRDNENALSWDTLGALFGQQMDELQNAPLYLQEGLLFPYVKGQEFVMALWSQGGFARIDEAFKRPPVSSSQILHPDRYISEPLWRPKLSDWQAPEFQGERFVIRNVAGEFGLSIFLKLAGRRDAGALAAHWDGDRYAVYRVGGKPVVWWRTAWRDAEGASRFYTAMNESLGSVWTTAGDPSKWKLLIRGPTEVELFRAPDDETLDALLKLAEREPR